MKYLMLVCVDPELPGDIEVWLDMVGDRRLDGAAFGAVEVREIQS